MNLSNDDFAQLVHEIAADSSCIIYTGHARKQMKARKVLRTHVDTCLQKGHVIEPAHINMHGNWHATMARRVAGLDVKVAVAIETKKCVAVVTVMKED